MSQYHHRCRVTAFDSAERSATQIFVHSRDCAATATLGQTHGPIAGFIQSPTGPVFPAFGAIRGRHYVTALGSVQ